ncbi:hypothetical protein MTO96_003326 [Rhipicephalus appendiculatus]|uniref:Uncharacterized protein n=1 Tax=Rhipicephalus appendiculatus TaxID=34631 RepID=A0A131Z658_RHIAP
MDVAVENVVNAVAEGSTAATTERDSKADQQLFALIVAVVLTLVVVCPLGFILDKLGFGKDGVKPGSLAATWQASMHGNVPKWSTFAVLQSWGVKGIPGMFRFCVGYVTFIFSFVVLVPKQPR